MLSIFVVFYKLFKSCVESYVVFFNLTISPDICYVLYMQRRIQNSGENDENDDDNDKGDDGKLFCRFESITMSSHYVKPYQPTIICSKLTLETLAINIRKM